MQGDQAVLAGGGSDLLPEHPGSDARDAGERVDQHLAHAVGAQEDGVGEIAERGGVVACALRGHPQAVVAGDRERGRDLSPVTREGDGHGPLVGHQVPGLAGRVPRVVPGGRDLAEALPERGDGVERDVPCG